MNRILEDRKDDISKAMQGLCEAVGRLAMVRDDVVETLKTLPPGHENDRLALALERTCQSLVSAAGTVPNECWDILVRHNAVGGHEVKERLETMIHNTVFINNQDRAVRMLRAS